MTTRTSSSAVTTTTTRIIARLNCNKQFPMCYILTATDIIVCHITKLFVEMVVGGERRYGEIKRESRRRERVRQMEIKIAKETNRQTK